MTLAMPGYARSDGGQTGAGTIESGDYEIDPGHSRMIFSYNHFGYSTSSGLFTRFDAKIHAVGGNLTASAVVVTIDMTGIDTTVPKLDEELKAPGFFDVSKYPTATFRSTAIRPTGPSTALVTGDLTLHGVTRPVNLDVIFNRGGPHPMSHVVTLGFNATAQLKRSDFGVQAFAPMVGDEVTLTISAEFKKI
jgi:polyisoprenoid-binding protein YceI